MTPAGTPGSRRDSRLRLSSSLRREMPASLVMKASVRPSGETSMFSTSQLMSRVRISSVLVDKSR